jgi:hypothetical protein
MECKKMHGMNYSKKNVQNFSRQNNMRTKISS